MDHSKSNLGGPFFLVHTPLSWDRILLTNSSQKHQIWTWDQNFDFESAISPGRVRLQKRSTLDFDYTSWEPTKMYKHVKIINSGVRKPIISIIMRFTKESYCKLSIENFNPNSQNRLKIINFNQIPSKIWSKTGFWHQKVLLKSKLTNRAAYRGILISAPSCYRSRNAAL